MAFSLSSLSKKHIPTILGVVVLLSGLVGGVFLVRSTNTNSFLPRASPQTTPQNLKITNVTDSSFTVSWVTDSNTVGFIKYGQSASALNSTVNDDRDQSSGSTGLYRNHHVTVRSLSAQTPYFFKIGTGTQELYDNQGSPYTISTVNSISSQAKTIYGEIVMPTGGTPAAGALVYISADNIAPLSAIVQNSGSWVLSLAQARTKDLKSAATIDSTTNLSLLVLSPTDTTTSIVTVPLSNAQPVPQITVGTNQDFTSGAPSPTPLPSGVPSPTPAPPAEQSKFTSALLAPATQVATASGITITYPFMDQDVVTVATPQFQGNAPSGNRVTATVNGQNTQTSTVTTDPSGIWTFTPISKLSTGSYTLTISTTISGVKQSATRLFKVDLSQAGNVPSFTASSSGTLSPTPTPMPTATPLIVASVSARVSNPSTSSGVPVTGSETPTLLLVFMGICLLLIGTGFWVVL